MRESSASATGLDLAHNRSPVPVTSLSLASSSLTIKVGTELDVRIKYNIMTELRIFENLEQVELAQSVPGDGRMQSRGEDRSRA